MKIPLSYLRAFDAAARLLSFTLAAEELHLTQSAISQQIRQLEAQLGFSLFRRLTRRLELTDEGRRLYESVRRALHDIDQTVEQLRDDGARGSVTASVGSSFAANWLIPRMSGFATDCPGIDLKILPSDALIDLRREDSVDLAVRFARNEAAGCLVKSLGPEPVFVVCSPTLLQASKAPETPADLRRFPLLHNEVSDQEVGGAGDWRTWLDRLGLSGSLDAKVGPRLPRSDLLVQAAVHGQGMALVWHTMVRNELRDGRLVKAFDGGYEVSSAYYLHYTPEALARPKVAKVVDWMTGKARQIEL